jgi:hypothetical protein
MADNLGDTTGVTEGALAGAAAIKTFTASLAAAPGALADYMGSLGNLGAALKGTGTITQGAANSISVLSLAVGDSTKAFEGWGAAVGMAGSGFAKMSAPLMFITDGAEKAAKAAEKLSTSWSATHNGAISKTLQEAAEGARAAADKIKEMAGAMDGAQAMQNDYINMMMASGQATQLFAAAGDDLSRLPGMLKNVSTQTKDLQVNFGLTAAEATAFYQGMGKIPGALNEITASTGGSAAAMAAMGAAIRLAHGAGMALGTAIDQQKLAYEDFNKTGEKANEFMARQSELSEKLQIPLEKATSVIGEMADKFKYLGDNTRSVNQIMMDMVPRMMKNGMGFGPALEQTKAMISGLAEMTVGQKAFLSLRSGGPGGLLGAAQIDKALRDPSGKGAADLMKKSQASMMRQFGGHIATTDSAASGAAGAAEQRKQISQVQSGMFGIGKGATDAQAVNILNAMAQKQGTQKPEDMKKLLDELAGKGAKFEGLNKSDLTPILAELTSLKQYGGLELLAITKSKFGITNDQSKALMEKQAAYAQAEQDKAAKAQSEGKDIGDDTQSHMMENIKDTVVDAGKAALNGMTKPSDQFFTPASANDNEASRNAQYNKIVGNRPSAGSDPLHAAHAAQVQHATTASQRAHAAALASASTSKASTTASVGAHSSAAAPPSAKDSKPIVNVTVYIDGKQTSSRTEINQDAGNH